MYPLIDLQADGPLSILTFEVGETSKLAKRLIAEVTTLVTTAQTKKPLVYSTGNSLAAIYRTVPNWSEGLYDDFGRELFSNISRRVADIRSEYLGRIKFGVAGPDEFIEAPEGVWWQGKTPETAPRHTLPVFDGASTSRALEALTGRWVSEGHLVVIQQARAPARPEYASRPNETPDRDLDPMVRHANQIQAAYGTDKR